MANISLIYDYVDSNGINVIKSWLDHLTPRVKAKINSRLNALEQMNRSDWDMPMTEVLHGDKDGLIAVRVGFQGIAYRLLGYDGPYRGEFTLLAYCIERGNKYVPLDIGRKSFERRTDTESNTNTRRIRHDYR